VKNSWFLPISFSNIAPKKVSHRIPDLVLIYTPKEVQSRISVTRGSVFARQKGCTKKLFLGRLACTKERGTNQGRGENIEDKQEHKPATKTLVTGKRAGGSQKPIDPTPRKAGVGGTSNPRSAEPQKNHQNHQSQQGLG